MFFGGLCGHKPPAGAWTKRVSAGNMMAISPATGSRRTRTKGAKKELPFRRCSSGDFVIDTRVHRIHLVRLAITAQLLQGFPCTDAFPWQNCLELNLHLSFAI